MMVCKIIFYHYFLRDSTLLDVCCINLTGLVLDSLGQRLIDLMSLWWCYCPIPALLSVPQHH